MKRSHGKYAGKSRNLKSKGRVAITSQLRTFTPGEKVRIDINPRFASGLPHLRFNKRAGQVIGMQGQGVVIKFNDINKEKILVISGAHLVKT
jgi:ribosomal protein L21E